MDDQPAPKQDSEHPNTPLPPPSVTKPLHPEGADPATAQQLTEVEKQMSGFERATLRWAKSAVIMSGLAAIFVCAQWYEMHEGGIDTHALAVTAGRQEQAAEDMATAAGDQVDAANNFSDTSEEVNRKIAEAVKQLESAAENTKTTIRNSEKSFQQEQRAWVGVQHIGAIDISESKGVPVDIWFFNSGRTPARNVRVSANYILSPIPLAGPSPKNIATLAFRPSQSIAPQATYDLKLAVTIAGEPFLPGAVNGLQDIISKVKQIKDKTLVLYYFGILKYDDGFGHERETQYCVFLADPDSKAMAICDSFNDLD